MLVGSRTGMGEEVVIGEVKEGEGIDVNTVCSCAML
jgi:hypothetical protein